MICPHRQRAFRWHSRQERLLFGDVPVIIGTGLLGLDELDVQPLEEVGRDIVVGG